MAGRPPFGSADFVSLFAPNEQWSLAASHVQVFKFYEAWVVQVANDSQLKQEVTWLNQHGINIAIEMPALVATAQCGVGIEGFSDGATGALVALNRIKQAGGAVNYVALDEPFYFGSLYSGQNACRWSAEKIAQEVEAFVKSLQGFDPNIVIGDIEPVVSNSSVRQYEQWIETYNQVSGHYFPFFHMDTDWSRVTWPTDAKALEGFCRQRGIQFGIIYNGGYYSVTSDEQWLAYAADRMATYESQYGGHPDNVIFQSWHDHPVYLLPESSPHTFTHLILKYFGNRTSITIGTNGGPGQHSVSGKLMLRGVGIAGAQVRLTATQMNGSAKFAIYNISGVVPSGATTAVAGFRVNTECGCAGGSDFFVYSVGYTEGTSRGNLVPNGDFSSGLQGWVGWGNGTQMLRPSDMSPGSMLHVVSGQNQYSAINSGYFSVRAGENYTVAFAARVSPSSTGSGYFAIFFLFPSGSEISRRTISIAAPTISVGSVLTDADGAYRFDLTGLPFGVLLMFQVNYPGNDFNWPASAELSTVLK